MNPTPKTIQIFLPGGDPRGIRVAERQAKDANIILIEEPENHLSFTSMNVLINKIREKCAGKQIVIVTHSAYVLNKLGIEKVFFLHDAKHSSLKSLPADTQSYFKRLSGYDTLRVILAKKVILVEGPSDELVVQKAFKVKHGKLPIEAGVDVINVRGLSFARFLDIAKELKNEVAVVTDNDGDFKNNIEKKYLHYSGIGTIKIYADKNDKLKTLEPQIVAVNDLKVLNKVLGTDFKIAEDAADYMVANKTECALAIFETVEKIVFPAYVQAAIN